MNNALLLFIISVLPVIIMGVYIYLKDKNKEPFKLLIKLFLGGFLATVLTLIISTVLEVICPFFGADVEKMSIVQLFFYVFIGVALVEEICKWIFLYSFSYYENDFDEFYDMIVYAVFVSLGFAFVENVLYVFRLGVASGILRSILSVPAHAFFGVFMGYYLGLAKIASVNRNKLLEKKNVLFSILIPVFLHGTFDFCLMSSLIPLMILFVIFILLLYVNSFKKIKKVSSINRSFK